ncbi:osmotically-inducible protein OsmY [Pararhizobium capsulatum DSM 1112]|uniref:Osmotically-inducible protein OsmY n=1 Tax=Pararhizobium capsulatum DSM 1112 TaxID=1121113 RepID=A0ABU0BQN0_9HYPH|nr:BON domain-containing protein [Pararhizobium capsulatum]MDQ0320553.1 osmotically-inducible protein OsmY [Pararhizobium capsulatum DSM 1112]
MVFKERTFYGREPEDLFPGEHADLETRVANCLTTVTGLDASDVTVVAKGNTIMLSGIVQTPEEIDRAAEAAESVPGVAEVINRISSLEFRLPSASS